MPKPVSPVTRAPTKTSINIDGETWQDFKVVCARKKTTVTVELNRMIRAFVAKRSK